MTVIEGLDGGHAWVGRVIRLLVVLIVLSAAALAGYWFFVRDDTPATKTAAPQEATVTRGRLVSTLQTTGTAQSTITSKLSFSTAGQVTALNVILGQKVTAGQELAAIDPKDAQRKVDSAASQLETAKLRLQQLQEPPKEADVAAARQSVLSATQQVTSAKNSVLTAQNNVITAQANLDKLTAPPAVTDVIAADNAVTAAQTALTNANSSVDNAFTSLVSAQRNYCINSTFFTVDACQPGDIPLKTAKIADLTAELAHPPGTDAQKSTITTAINGLFSANTAYLNAKGSITTAQGNLDSAKAKRAALDAGPTASDLATARASVASAQVNVQNAQGSVTTAEAGVVSAQAKLDQLLAGTAATDIALQQQSVKQAQIAYQEALDGLANLVLRAPYDGTVSAIGVAVGDQATATTAAVTITDPTGVRIDLQVSETDFSSLKAGLFGQATFEALPNQTFFVKITGVGSAGTVTQGVLTYTAQAQILRGADLQANAADIQKVVSAISGAGRTGTGGTGTGGTGAGGTGAGGTGAGGTGAGGTGAGGTGRPTGANGAGNGATNGGGATNGSPAAGAGATGSPAAGATGAAGAGGFGGAGFGAATAAQTLPSAGMNASVNLLLNVQDDVLILPTTAIRRVGRAASVNVILPDGTIEQRTIQVGGSDSTNTAITSGLNEGDKVRVGTVSTGTTGAGAAVPTPRSTPAGGVR